MIEIISKIRQDSIHKFERFIDFSAKNVERIPYLPAKDHLIRAIRSKLLHKVFFRGWIPFSIFYKIALALGMGTWIASSFHSPDMPPDRVFPSKVMEITPTATQTPNLSYNGSVFNDIDED